MSVVLIPTTSNNNFNIHSRIKLSTIELPIFDGNYNLYIKFRNTFELLIHYNDTLTNIEKFYKHHKLTKKLDLTYAKSDTYVEN